MHAIMREKYVTVTYFQYSTQLWVMTHTHKVSCTWVKQYVKYVVEENFGLSAFKREKQVAVTYFWIMTIIHIKFRVPLSNSMEDMERKGIWTKCD